MTTLNPAGETTITAILALLDAAAAIVQLPADVRRQAIGVRTFDHLLDDAKALDRLIEGNRKDAEDAEKPPEPLGALCASAVDALPPTAQNAPKRPRATTRPQKIPAKERTPVLPPIPAATMKVEATNGTQGVPDGSNGIDKSYSSPESSTPEVRPGAASYSIPFAEFDRLVRREMKRLAMDGRLPGHKLWDSERTPPLPTLSAVILRYNADGLVGLAEALGLEPPLSVQKKGEPAP